MDGKLDEMLGSESCDHQLETHMHVSHYWITLGVSIRIDTI